MMTVSMHFEENPHQHRLLRSLAIKKVTRSINEMYLDVFCIARHKEGDVGRFLAVAREVKHRPYTNHHSLKQVSPLPIAGCLGFMLRFNAFMLSSRGAQQRLAS